MTKTKMTVAQYYNEGKTGRGASALRFWLMPFMCFMLFGFSEGAVGTITATLCRFVVPASFILSGFFVLCPDREERTRKLIRAIKRSGLFFLVLGIVYFAINVVYFAVLGVDWVPEIIRLRTAFNFLVLNLWPFKIGESIWYVQSLFFAYIIILIGDKLRLYKIYPFILILLYLFMLISGELAGVIHLNFLDYTYIPGGTITRALPYLLLGMLIRQYADKLIRLTRRWIYLIFFFLGLGLAFLEIQLLYSSGCLVYTGHMLGYGVAGAAICLFALSAPRLYKGFPVLHGRSYARRIYAICQPIAFGLTLLAGIVPPLIGYILVTYLGAIVYIICFFLSYLIGLMLFNSHRRRKKSLERKMAAAADAKPLFDSETSDTDDAVTLVDAADASRLSAEETSDTDIHPAADDESSSAQKKTENHEKNDE